MANYNSVSRTNYFKVKDKNTLAQILEDAVTEGFISLWEEDDRVAFGCNGTIQELDYKAIQKCLPDGEYASFRRQDMKS